MTLSHFEDASTRTSHRTSCAPSATRSTRSPTGDSTRASARYRHDGERGEGAQLNLSARRSDEADTDSSNVFLQDRIATGAHSAQRGTRLHRSRDRGLGSTWNVDYGFAITPKDAVFALAGTGFRAPDATDRFGFGGNPDLEPEHSRNYEAGVRYAWRPASLRFSAFQNEIDDLIEFS